MKILKSASRAVGSMLLVLTPFVGGAVVASAAIGYGTVTSCKALDAALGVGGSDEEAEGKIKDGEAVARGFGDAVLPGAGALAALAFGVAARAYVKKRKAKAA